MSYIPRFARHTSFLSCFLDDQHALHYVPCVVSHNVGDPRIV